MLNWSRKLRFFGLSHLRFTAVCATAGWSIALVLLFSVELSSQHRFDRFTPRQNTVITSGSFLLAGGAFFLERNVKPFKPEDLARFEAQTLRGIAAWPAGRYDLRAAKTSDILAIASGVLPATALLFEDGRRDVVQGIQMYWQTAFLNFALTEVTKSLVHRPRPFMYNPNAPENVRLHRDARLSFFSGHTSTAASFSFFTASVIHRYSDQRSVRTAAWIGAAIIPALTGYFRMRAGKHFFSDVAVGYLAGAAIGITVPLMHTRREPN